MGFGTFILSIVTSSIGAFFYDIGNAGSAINAWVITGVIVFDNLIQAIKENK